NHRSEGRACGDYGDDRGSPDRNTQLPAADGHVRRAALPNESIIQATQKCGPLRPAFSELSLQSGCSSGSDLVDRGGFYLEGAHLRSAFDQVANDIGDPVELFTLIRVRMLF